MALTHVKTVQTCYFLNHFMLSCHVTNLMTFSVVWCQIWFIMIMSHQCRDMLCIDVTSQVKMSCLLWQVMLIRSAMSCYVTSCHKMSYHTHLMSRHANLWHGSTSYYLNPKQDYELRLPTTFKGSFPSHPPLSLSPPPPPLTVRVRRREGWRGTGKRESLVRRLLLSFLVCLCG